MAYSDQIELLKNSLNGYSAEEEKLSALYKTAIDNANERHKASEAQRDKQYYADRNTVFADNARQQRNFDTAIAARGLGFSGEAAQSKLNGRIDLSNRLGELKQSKDKADLEADLQLNDLLLDLETDRFNQLRALTENKNALNADIAKMELDKEASDADREMEWKNAEANRQADWKNAEANRQADWKNAEADRQAEKANADADRQAEKDLQSAKLRAEKDMLAAELQAKYSSVIGNGGSGGSGSGDKDAAEELPPQEETEDTAFIPDIDAKELAQKLVSATGSKSLTDRSHEYMVNKFLLQLLEDYKVDRDYYDSLVFVLKAYGYTERSQIRMKSQVVGYEAEQRYDKVYQEEYDKYIVKGVSIGTVQAHAEKTALNEELEYIYDRSDNITEFKICCREIGVSEENIAQFINAKNAVDNNRITSGSRDQFATILPQ